MLTHVKIENYRGFQSYRLHELTPVNLLVGKNNSGKTALLECIHFLASGGDPMVLVNAATRRGEVVSGGRDEPPFLDVSHFFHGHDIGPGSRFSLTAQNGMPPVTVEAVPLDDVEPQPTLFEELPSARPAFALKIEGWRPESKGGRPFMLSEEGALLVHPRVPLRRYFGDPRREGPPIVFITPDSSEPESLGAMWNQVLRDKQEGKIRNAMRILEPDLDDIVFQTGEFTVRPRARRSGVLVSFSGHKRRVPLGSMGDGMRRLLELSISLNHAKGGYLLIDEIDTGLHYSIMAKMWDLVVRTARKSRVKVFATTHSADCVRGLGIVCKQSPELQQEVSAHKIERDLEQDVAFSGADVLSAVEQDIEIR
ncbi:MAG TPA: ATP-binding protein [Phycisphaerae bacterium]|nr:ATP-binding protein [Phycisphaerae bacterium]